MLQSRYSLELSEISWADLDQMFWNLKLSRTSPRPSLRHCLLGSISRSPDPSLLSSSPSWVEAAPFACCLCAATLREPKRRFSCSRPVAGLGVNRDVQCRVRRNQLQPLPRPGYDRDGRLAQVEDDPRYFPGAELGKAQKAAMGIKGMHGRNTASFDPRSTLVRPAMRVVYGRKGHEFGAQTKPDDVVVVPELLCATGDVGILNRLLAELQQLQLAKDAKDARGQPEPSDVAAVQSLGARMCQYFQVDPDSATFRVRWHRGGQIAELASRNFGQATGPGSCMLNLSLGATCELAFKRRKTGEILYFPQENGTLLLMGHEVVSSWLPGESKQPERDQVSIAVSGRSRQAVEETALSDTVNATKARLCFCFERGSPHDSSWRAIFNHLTSTNELAK